MKIMVVDDNPDILEVLSSAIRLCGHTVDTACDGFDAINLQLKNRYDVIVTDADMPRMDGFELCKLMKERFPDLYIIGMSGTYGENVFREAGADMCLAKPFSILDMQEAVEGGLRSSERKSARMEHRKSDL
ncbi:MAG: response regulator [Syntrophales bacterium]|nr:response regulator [Syntrophales bacterium]